MSADEYGTIIDVQTTNVGEWLTADALSGASVLGVTDASTFEETGGQLVVNEKVYSYTSADPSANTITLATTLTENHAADDRVEIYPPAPVMRALVDFGIDAGEAVTAIVPHSMKDVLSDGMREEAARETVLVEERSPGELYVKDVIAAAATIEARAISGDGYAPIESPNPVVIGGIGSLHVRWTAIVNPDPITYEVHVSTVSDFVPDDTTFVGSTAGTALTIRTTANDLLLAYDTDYFVKLVAVDLDGKAPSGFQSSAQLTKVTSDDVSANYVYAGQVVADQIVGGDISAEVTVSGRISTRVGGVGGGVDTDSAGVTIYDSAGIPQTVLAPAQSIFKGDAEIANLTSLAASIRGTSNEIATGAEVKLASGAVSVSNPSTAPSVVQDWQSVTFTKPGDASFNAANITSIHFLNGSWVCGYRDGSFYKVYRFSTAGVYMSALADPITSATALQSVMLSMADLAVDRVYTVASNGTLFRHRALTDTVFFFDDFTSSINTTDWPTRIGVSWSSGRVFMPTDSRIASPWNKDMNEAYVSAKVDITNPPNDGMYARFELYHSNNNEVAMIFVKGESGGQTLYFRQWDPYTNESSGTASITYNSTTHAWWKISEKAGRFYFYTSPDGDNWTLQYDNPHTVTDTDLQTIQVEFQTESGGSSNLVEMYVDKVEHGQNNDSLSITLPATTNEDGDVRTIGTDGTNILVAEHNNTGSNDRIRVQAFNPTTLALVSTTESADDASFGGPLAGILKGNFDFGAARYVTKRAAGSTADWRVALTTSGGARQTSEEFPPNSAVKSIGWDGSNFWSLGSDGKLYKYTTTLLSGAFQAGFTWYDSVATVHETMISPLNSFTLKRRARVTVTTPSIPAGGGSDDPNGVRIYLGATGALKLQSTPSPGVISVIFNSITNAGASPPGSNNFGGGGTPAKISNPSNSLVISGDGSITAASLTIPDVWTSYTPAFTNHGTATFSTLLGRWRYLAPKLVFVLIYFNVNAAGSGSTALNITLPTSPDRAFRQMIPATSEGLFVASMLGAGAIVCFTGGSGVTADRIRLNDNNATSQLGNLQGQHLLANGLFVAQGVYREA